MKDKIITLIGEPAATKLYNKFNSTNVILQTPLEELRAAGITYKQAKLLIAARELTFERNNRIITSSKDVVAEVEHLKYEDVEHFIALVLSRRNEVIGKVFLSTGGKSGTVVDAKVLYSRVLAFKPNAIILVHNHPSGNKNPSSADIDVTKKIVDAGKLLDIKVLDHVIIAHEEYTSFADEGLI